MKRKWLAVCMAGLLLFSAVPMTRAQEAAAPAEQAADITPALLKEALALYLKGEPLPLGVDEAMVLQYKEKTEREAAQAEAAQEAAQPEASEPEAEQPEASEPEAEQPEASEPEAEQSEASEPEAEQSEAEQPETSEPEASEPEAAQPEASEPEAAQPETSEPEASEPEAEQPEASEPETEQPEASEPEVEQPETSESEAEQPEEKESEIGAEQTPPPVAPQAEEKPEEPQTEAAPEAPEQAVTVTMHHAAGKLSAGDTITLKAHLTGFEGLDVRISWEYALGMDNARAGNFTVAAVGGLSHSFILNGETYDYVWRAVAIAP